MVKLYFPDNTPVESNLKYLCEIIFEHFFSTFPTYFKQLSLFAVEI